MNPRKRYLETMLFGSPDKIPFSPGNGRESTIARWKKEGMPEGMSQREALLKAIDIEDDKTKKVFNFNGVNFKPFPAYEEKILKHENGHYIVQTEFGSIVEMADNFNLIHLRSAKDFVTRKYHKFAVENEKDWQDMKRRLDASSKERFPADFEKRCEEIKQRNYTAGLGVPGIFWTLRDFCGLENLCFMMIEQPDLVKEMAEHWCNFILKITREVVSRTDIDFFHISEDMAYKEKSMISPAMCREFLMPVWNKWGQEIKGKCPLYAVDSDGDVEELIPLWIEAGINGCDPMEIAAGNDMYKYRKMFGKKMAFSGGVDKREIAKGGKNIIAEIKRIEPIVKSGGYLPSCDHGVPPDVSWPDFVEYSKLLGKVTGWLK